MRIAVCGCVHGQFLKLYNDLLAQADRPDLVVICGDIQAVRDTRDMCSMSAPKKYQVMGDFQFLQEKGAPLMTIVIGGNHEASTHLMEVPYGGWLAPNMYYMGLAGCVRYNGVVIAGLSGIYYEPDYLAIRNETMSLEGKQKYSVYHVRKQEIDRLARLPSDGHIDIMLSHDWPQGIEHHGNLQLLLLKKKFLTKDIRSGKLGSPPARDLLYSLKPKRWFSAHMHCRFSAVVEHSNGQKTEFESYSKPGHKDPYMGLYEVPSRSSKGLELDPDWLRILRQTIDGLQHQAARPDQQTTPKESIQSSFEVPPFGIDQTSAYLRLLRELN